MSRRTLPHGLRPPLSRGGARARSARRRLPDRPRAGDQPRLPRVRRGDRLRDVRRDPARPEGLSRRAAAHAEGRARSCSCRPKVRSTCATGRSGGRSRSARPGARRTGRAARSTAWTTIRWCTSPTATPRLRGVGGQGAADRGGVGVRRARRPRRHRVRVGRRIHARRPQAREDLARPLPVREPRRRRASRAPRRSARSRRTATGSST